MILDVSVVIPCYNAEDTLQRCLTSVDMQTDLPREIIVVNDGSDNPIDSMIDKLKVTIRIPIRLITQQNAGAPAARNAGIKASQGSYIAFLDADDIWLPEKLKIQYGVMLAEDLSLCGHGYACQAKELKNRDAFESLESVRVNKIPKWKFAFGNPLFTPTVMVRKKDFFGFDERFRRVDDYKAWLENFQPQRYGMISAILAAGFKPAIGHSGLTGSIDRMHESFSDVLLTLLNEGKIDLTFYLTARFIEALKLPVRRYRSKHVA